MATNKFVFLSIIMVTLQITSCYKDGNPQQYSLARIYSIKIDGSERKQIAIGYNFTLLPDGKIIYVNDLSLYSCNPDGSGKKIISPGGTISAVTYQLYMYKKKILLFQYLNSNTYFYVMNFDGSELTQLNVPSNIDIYRGITFSPDGSKIAFSNTTGLYIMNSDGSDQTQIKDSTNKSYCYNLNFSPDGNNVIYIYDIHDDDGRDLRIYNIKSLMDTSLFYNNSWGNEVRTFEVSKWNTLVFNSGHDINLINLNNFSNSFLHRGLDPHLSYDSSKITFINYDTPAIYVMDLITNSTELINVNLPGNMIWHPILSLDEKHVFFQTDTVWYESKKNVNNIVY